MSRALQLAPTGIPAMRPKRILAVIYNLSSKTLPQIAGYPPGVNGT
jgi:hypothetical protein